MLKLLNIGVGEICYQIIKKTMYTKRLVCVKVNNGHSEYFECTQGVRQGDGISPTLFNIFVNNVDQVLTKSECKQAKYGELTIDDLLLILESQEALSRGIVNLFKGC